MRTVIAMAILVVACARSLPAVTRPIAPQSPEALQVEAIIVAWNERGDLPALDADRLREMMVTDPPDLDSFHQLCPRGSAGCLVPWDTCTGPFAGLVCEGENLAIVAPTWADGKAFSPGTRLSVIRHEAVHRALEVAGISDSVHHDRRAWPYPCSAERMRIPAAQRPPPSAEELACRAPTVEERARTIATQR